MRETIGIKIDGQVAEAVKILDFIYDESGKPFALRYSANNGSTFTKYYYVLNLQGDVVKLINASGTVYASYTYNAYGEIISITDANGTAITSSTHIANINPLRYRGYYYDTETGFYYLQSRYYDPVIGRFINADSYASTGQGFLGTNMFAYCNNNPISFTDPAGTKLKIETSGSIFNQVKQAVQVVVSLIMLSTSKSGRKLIKGIMDSDKTCTITFHNDGNAHQAHNLTDAGNGKGSDSTVFYNPASDPDIFTLNPETQTGNYTKRPNYIGLAHELIHAYRSMNGIRMGDEEGYYAYISEIGIDQVTSARFEELYTVGILTDAGTIVTENMIRTDFGLQQRIKYGKH